MKPDELRQHDGSMMFIVSTAASGVGTLACLRDRFQVNCFSRPDEEPRGFNRIIELTPELIHGITFESGFLRLRVG